MSKGGQGHSNIAFVADEGKGYVHHTQHNYFHFIAGISSYKSLDVRPITIN